MVSPTDDLLNLSSPNQRKTLIDEKVIKIQDKKTELQKYTEKIHVIGLTIYDQYNQLIIGKTNFQLSERKQESEDKKIKNVLAEVRKFINRNNRTIHSEKYRDFDLQNMYADFARTQSMLMRITYLNRNYEERCITQGNERKNRDVAENHQGNGEHTVILIILLIAIIMAFLLLRLRGRNNEERHVTQGHLKENEDEEEEVEEKLQENGENLVISKNLDMHSTMDQIHNERHNSTGALEENTNRPIHPDDHRTTHDSQENNRIGMPGCMTNENRCKVQAKQIPSSEANTDASSDESFALLCKSTVESTRIRLYPNIIRNETCRMMSSIDMVISEAEDLFGLERSRIFFDLLASELCYFGSTRVISEFVPNMVESTVRKNIISFFEHPCDMMNILMTLLLRCPDSERLQQLPMQNFISFMKSVITSSQKTKSKGRKKLSLEGNIYIMVDPEEFERSLGEEIPEDVLNRFRHGDEMVVHRFVDKRPERHQPSDRRENRPIHSIYFPSDCRLFIYIPTETGSYWHQLDMRRANRISKYYGR